MSFVTYKQYEVAFFIKKCRVISVRKLNVKGSRLHLIPVRYLTCEDETFKMRLICSSDKWRRAERPELLKNTALIPLTFSGVSAYLGATGGFFFINEPSLRREYTQRKMVFSVGIAPQQ